MGPQDAPVWDVACPACGQPLGLASLQQEERPTWVPENAPGDAWCIYCESRVDIEQPVGWVQTRDTGDGFWDQSNPPLSTRVREEDALNELIRRMPEVHGVLLQTRDWGIARALIGAAERHPGAFLPHVEELVGWFDSDTYVDPAYQVRDVALEVLQAVGQERPEALVPYLDDIRMFLDPGREFETAAKSRAKKVMWRVYEEYPDKVSSDEIY